MPCLLGAPRACRAAWALASSARTRRPRGFRTAAGPLLQSRGPPRGADAESDEPWSSSAPAPGCVTLPDPACATDPATARGIAFSSFFGQGRPLSAVFRAASAAAPATVSPSTPVTGSLPGVDGLRAMAALARDLPDLPASPFERPATLDPERLLRQVFHPEEHFVSSSLPVLEAGESVDAVECVDADVDEPEVSGLAAFARALAAHNRAAERASSPHYRRRKPAYHVLNMIQRRRVKMNRHKYKKLRKRTRALRRRQGKS